MCTCIKLAKNISSIYTNNYLSLKKGRCRNSSFFHLGVIFHGTLTVNRNKFHISPKIDQWCITGMSVDQLVALEEITTLLIGGF